MVKSRTFQYIWLCVLLLIPMTMVRAKVMDTGFKVDTRSATAEKGSAFIVSPANTTQDGERKKVKKKRGFAPVNQMVPITVTGVDTLSILDRLSIRTNMVDWALLLPNIGAEFDIRNTNWNRWAVGLNVKYNWQTSHTYNPGMVYNIFEVRLEGRQYWRARQISNRLPKHTHIWDKAISIRRSRVKHKSFTWYRGVYASYGKYSLLFGGDGHQGTAISGGVCYGFVRPMFAFENGNSIDLEFGGSAGVVYYKDKVYRHDAETDCYPIVAEKPGAILPMLNELRVGLVYRFGHVPVLAKYRYRRDVDVYYDMLKDSVLNAHVHYRDSATRYKETYESILRKFWSVYDSIAGADRSADRLRLQQFREERAKEQAVAAEDKKSKKTKKSKKADKEAQEPQDNKSADTPKERKEDESHE